MILSALLTSVGINLFLCVLFFTLYSILKKQPSNADVYTPRLIATGKSDSDTDFTFERLLPSPGWLRRAWDLSEDELLSISGLDGVVFMRTFTFSLKVFSFIGLVGIFILLPINYVGNQLTDFDFFDLPNKSLDLFSISNVEDGSKRLWVHFAAVYLTTGVVCYLLYHADESSNENLEISLDREEVLRGCEARPNIGLKSSLKSKLKDHAGQDGGGETKTGMGAKTVTWKEEALAREKRNREMLVYNRKRGRKESAVKKDKMVPSVGSEMEKSKKGAEIELEAGFLSTEESSLGEKIRSREALVKEIELLRKGKMKEMDAESVEAKLKLGRMFEACNEGNKGMIARMMEENAKRDWIEAEEERLAKMAKFERIAALNTDSEDYDGEEGDGEEEDTVGTEHS